MSYSENNKRVVKNTMFLYIRMFFILLIGLYTSRKALEILGVVDFGLYNVVGGVVAMFTFVSTTMSNASNRFFAYALGQNNETNQRKTFQTMWFVYLIVTFVLLILGIIGGYGLVIAIDLPLRYGLPISTMAGMLLMIPFAPFFFAGTEALFAKYNGEMKQASVDLTNSFLMELKNNVNLSEEDKAKIEEMLSKKNSLEQKTNSENEDDVSFDNQSFNIDEEKNDSNDDKDEDDKEQ